jgi:hypothetical protein
MSLNSHLILVFAILSFASIGFFAGALWCFFRTRLFLRAARETEGVVVANAIARNSDSGETFVPIVQFVTAGNARIEITGRMGANPPAYRVGALVRIAYLPKRPHEARILTFFGLYWLPLMFASFSVVLAFAAMVFLFNEVQ